MRLNIPTVFVSGGPMEAGEWNGQHLDLIDAMIKSADDSVSDSDVADIERMLVLLVVVVRYFYGKLDELSE